MGVIDGITNTNSASDQQRNNAELGFSLERTVKRIARRKTTIFTGLNVTHAQVHGHDISFCWNNPHDPIQGHLRHGRFYEADDLAMLARWFPVGGTLIDVGANVGNHTLYFAKMLSATKVIPIEPNPQVIPLLIANVQLNGLSDRVDLSYVGFGLSDRRKSGFGMEARSKNVGGARMIPGDGDIEVLAGSDVVGNLTPDLIKIDVEGMEMDVLSGFAEVIEAHRPLIFVEVDKKNDVKFKEWVEASIYRIVETTSRYQANTNYLLKAKT